jgi:hypothetical protein
MQEVHFEAWWGILPSIFICWLLFGQAPLQPQKSFRCTSSDNSLFYFPHTVVHSYQRVMRSKTYRGYVNLPIIPNTIYNVLLMYNRIDTMHLDLNEGPFCPMFCTKLKEPCSSVIVPHGPYIYFPNILCVEKEGTQLYISVLKSLCPSRKERPYRALATQTKLA